MGDKLDEIMGYIDIVKQNIRSAALFLCKVKKSLKEGIIKRLENEIGQYHNYLNRLK